MLGPIDLSDDGVAARVVEIQRAAYEVEAELIGFNEIPQLHESIGDVRATDLQWIGSWEEGQLAGILAWSRVDDRCDIDRLAVHPNLARRGHGRELVSSFDRRESITVSTGTLNLPAMRLYESLGFTQLREREISPGVKVTDLVRAAR